MDLSISHSSVKSSVLGQSRICNSPVILSQRVFLPLPLQQRSVQLFSRYLTTPPMEFIAPHAVVNNSSPSTEIAQGVRIGEVKRVTKETNVSVKINLDGSATTENNTGIPFLDHMLDQLASHGLFDVHVKATGDIHIDDHHTNEDIALAIGTALLQALGDRKGINRFGDFSAPLDEALVHVSLDLSGRPHLGYDLHIPTERVGTYDTQLVEHFFQSLVNTSGMTLHIRQFLYTFLLGGILTTSSRQPSRHLQEPFGKQQSMILAVEEVFQARKVSFRALDASSIAPKTKCQACQLSTKHSMFRNEIIAKVCTVYISSISAFFMNPESSVF
ncbi:imidazoleglycerol-phosphate dehydratase [Striga asiatica]|uniref:imidazoleglycerol-phosphate dehydratase n=1 Tax=Striga asiatica TaxID=4170 RepID=A0A5A7PQX3_STRAF|nr:imidazoleglycerol-phosphate dehydratase [Striga asiatica]